MQCVIYRSAKKYDTYLFVEQEDDFARVPESLLGMLGKLEKVMALDLAERDSLAQVSTQQVISALKDQGYYLQLPPNAYVTGQG